MNMNSIRNAATISAAIFAGSITHLLLPLPCASAQRTCSQDGDCGDGGACALEEALDAAALVCCPNGKKWIGGYQYVCADLPPGAACAERNEACASGVCGMDGTCVPDKLPAGSPCRRGGDDGDEMCSTSAAYYQGSTMGFVCADLPTGASCNGENSYSFNDLCSSGICGGDNLCAGDPLSSGSPCLRNNHESCSSKVCAREEALSASGYVCCPSGERESVSSVGQVCTDLPLGSACGGSGGICKSGTCGPDGECVQDKVQGGDQCSEGDDVSCSLGVCAREESGTRANYVCCSSGEKIWSGRSDIGFVCSNLPIGASCSSTNSMCASGVCGRWNKCVEEKAPNGSGCNENNPDMCSSGVCAKDGPLFSGKYICCGESEYKSYSGGFRACTDLPFQTGDECGSNNSVCASRVCGMDNLCLDQKLSNGSPCRQNEDTTCSSGKCARQESDEAADFVCCIEGKVRPNYSIGYVCANQPAGAKCSGEDSLCESGVCSVDGLCIEANQPVGAKCSGEDSLCESGVCGVDGLCIKQVQLGDDCSLYGDKVCALGGCGRKEATVTSEFICCEERTVLFDLPSSLHGFDPVCTDLLGGLACNGDDSLCASGSCGEGNICDGENVGSENSIQTTEATQPVQITTTSAETTHASTTLSEAGTEPSDASASQTTTATEPTSAQSTTKQTAVTTVAAENDSSEDTVATTVPAEDPVETEAAASGTADSSTSLDTSPETINEGGGSGGGSNTSKRWKLVLSAFLLPFACLLP